MDLFSPRFPRVLIYMISDVWTSWSFHHNCLPTSEELDLSFMDIYSARFSRVSIYMIFEWWSSWSLNGKQDVVVQPLCRYIGSLDSRHSSFPSCYFLRHLSHRYIYIPIYIYYIIGGKNYQKTYLTRWFV